MITKTTNKKLRPKAIEGYLKYICDTCSQEHWVSFKEAKCKQFVIVCKCDRVLRVQAVEKIVVKHNRSNREKKPSEKKETHDSLIVEAKQILSSYGFTAQEIDPLIKKLCRTQIFNSSNDLVKALVIEFGEKNNVQQN